MLTCVPPFLSQTLVAHSLKNYIKVGTIGAEWCLVLHLVLLGIPLLVTFGIVFMLELFASLQLS